MLKKDARMRAFHAVATLGNFTKAADALSLTQQAVSFQIKSLEDEVGNRLLVRQGKNLELTETGEILLGFAKQILDLYSAAEDALGQHTGVVGGSLSIGATGSIAKYCLPSAISEFRKNHQAVSVSVSVANSEDVVNLLTHEAVDLGVISGGPVDLSRFVVQPFFDDELVFVASADNPITNRQPLTLSDLRACDYIIREKGSGTRNLMEGYFMDRGTDPSTLSVAAVMGSTESVKASVASSNAIAMVSRLSLDEQRGLVVLDTDAGSLFRSFYIVRLRDSYLRVALDRFVKALRASNAFLTIEIQPIG
jgi:LysR family transcriptional regulator, transcriptional activator of the cysJI operon